MKKLTPILLTAFVMLSLTQQDEFEKKKDSLSNIDKKELYVYTDSSMRGLNKLNAYLFSLTAHRKKYQSEEIQGYSPIYYKNGKAYFFIDHRDTNFVKMPPPGLDIKFSEDTLFFNQ